MPVAISQFPNCTNRAGPRGLGVIWEIGKYVPLAISQVPNFTNRAGPCGLGSFGNWKIKRYVPVAFSQFPKSCWAIWAGVNLGNWEICTRSHFPISHFPNRAGPHGLGSFGKLGNLHRSPTSAHSIRGTRKRSQQTGSQKTLKTILEARKLEHHRPPTLNRRKEEHQQKSSYVYVSTVWSLLSVIGVNRFTVDVQLIEGRCKVGARQVYPRAQR